jgi:ABC-type transport system substrate-binding protein
MIQQHDYTPVDNKGLSRRQLLRAGLWGIPGWASWSVVSCQRSLVLDLTPAHASEQPRSGGTLTMWTQGDPPNIDLHQHTIFMASWAMAPCYHQLMPGDSPQPTRIAADPVERWEAALHEKSSPFSWYAGVKFHDG